MNRQTSQLELEYIEQRIQSCKSYTGTYTSCEVAGSGLYALSFWTFDPDDDRLCCLQCGLVLKSIPEGLSLVLLHLICSYCPFMQHLLEKLKSDAAQSGQVEGGSAVFRVREEVDVNKEDEPEQIYNKYNSIRYVTLYLSETVRSRFLQTTLTTEQLEPSSMDILADSITLGSNADATQMAREDNRTETFRTFANDHRLPISRLVQAGFYWTGEGLNMKTFCCGETSSDWTSDSDPILRHAQLARSCTFLNSQYQPEYLGRLMIGNEEYEPPQPQLLIARVLPKHIKPIMDSRPVVSVRNNWKKFVVDGDSYDTLKEELKDCISERIKYGRGGYRSENEVITDLQRLRIGRQERQNKTSTESEKLKGLQVFIDNSYTREIMKQLEKKAHEKRQATINQPGGPLNMDADEVSSNLRCIICLSNVREILYVPCTHLVTCAGCSLTQSLCPICRSAIKGTVKINLLPTSGTTSRSQPVRQQKTIDLVNPKIAEIDLRAIIEAKPRASRDRAERSEMLGRVEDNKMDEAGAVDNTIYKTKPSVTEGASTSVVLDQYDEAIPPEVVQRSITEVFKRIQQKKSAAEEKKSERSGSSTGLSAVTSTTLPPAEDDMVVE